MGGYRARHTFRPLFFSFLQEGANGAFGKEREGKKVGADL